jgi:hypothetical protein
MQLTDFSQGQDYIATRTTFKPPDGSPLIYGGLIQFTVLAPADATNRCVFDGEKHMRPTAAEVANWAGFLHVCNHKSGKVHLLHPESLASAELVADGLKPGDRVYYLIDRCTEVAGRVVSYDVETGRVGVRDDDTGQVLYGFEEHTRPNDD